MRGLWRYTPPSDRLLSVLLALLLLATAANLVFVALGCGPV